MNAERVATAINEINTKNSNAQASVGTMTATATSNYVVQIATEVRGLAGPGPGGVDM